MITIQFGRFPVLVNWLESFDKQIEFPLKLRIDLRSDLEAELWEIFSGYIVILDESINKLLDAM